MVQLTAGKRIASALVSLATGTALFLVSSSSVTRVAPGESLQAALNAAQCGAVLEVDAGTVYGNIVLSKNCGGNPIVIRSSRASELPEGVRVTPAQAPLLAKLQSTVAAEPVIKTTAGAQGYRFIGVEVSTATPTAVIYDLVRFGDGRQAQTTLASVPRGLSIDRSWIHGWPTQDVQRGVAMNCADCEVVNSYVSDIHGVGFDTQAVCAWNTPGPLRLINNYLEGAGENVLIGGADPASADMIPSDIQIRRNYVFKPLTWKVGHPTYAGKHWTVKNNLELKNARNVVIDGNVFENDWTDGQTGIPILFTTRNQEGTAPYSIIANVSFTNNVVRNAQGGINLLGSDNEKPSQRAQAALIANNVFDKITGPLITINGYPDVTLERNTALMTCAEGCNTTTFYSQPSPRFIGRNNVIQERPYGMYGEGGLAGKATLDKWAPEGAWVGNVVATPYETRIDGNEYVAALIIAGDYRTPYAGKGADIDKQLAAQAGVVVVSAPSPSPSPSVVPTIAPSPLPTPSPSASVPVGLPIGSTVEIISNANVRERPSTRSDPEKFIAQMGWRGVTTDVCQQDTTSVNVYCPVNFDDSKGSGYVAIQFLRVVVAQPGPSPTPTAPPSTPSPTPVSTPSPVPSPVPTSTPTPQPSPIATPSPRPSPVTFCPSGTRPTNGCVCRNGFRGNSGKCQ